MNERGGRRRQAGATLVATVLVVATLLAALLALCGQQAVVARRGVAEGAARLQAGYAADAGLARAQARLSAASRLLSPAAYAIPEDTPPQALLADVLALCGLSSPPAGSTVLCQSRDPQGGLLGGVAGLEQEGNPRLNLFVRYARPGAGDVVGVPDAELRAFWAGLLRGRAPGSAGSAGTLNGQDFAGEHGLTLLAVERPAPDLYRLTFGRPEARGTGQGAGGARRVLAVAAAPQAFVLTLGRFSFARPALFVDQPFVDEAGRRRGERVSLGGELRGPLHTNGQFLFSGTPRFAGRVSSAGCPAEQGADCPQPQPGAFLGARFVPRAQLAPSETAPLVPGCAECARPHFTGGVDWASLPVPLPTTDEPQRRAARESGLYLRGDLDALSLGVDRVAGQDAQRLSYTPRGGAPVALAVLESGAVLRQVGGGWRPAGPVDGEWVAGAPAQSSGGVRPFGGVVYVEGSVAALAGPARTRPADPLSAPPALAPFARLTVAAGGDLHVRSDLRLSEVPCPVGTSDPLTEGCVPGARAALGLYSSGGDVLLDSPARYGGAGVPPGVTLHAFLMSARGRVGVDGYAEGTTQDRLGDVTVVGGVTEAYYGPFGLAGGQGFGRVIRADARAEGGLAPPAFPLMPGWSVTAPDFTLRGQPVQAAPGETP